jgi:hypothetical protein
MAGQRHFSQFQTLKKGHNKNVHCICALLIMPLLTFALVQPSAGKPKGVTVIDTGSTNRIGFQVTLDETGSAQVQPRTGESHQVKLDQAASARFLHAVKAAGTLRDLPATHCAKSASFGSKLFVEVGDDRSPDLSCPTQDNAQVEALKQQATEILQHAQSAAGLQTTRAIIDGPIIPKKP